jgi:hypothetical protein
VGRGIPKASDIQSTKSFEIPTGAVGSDNSSAIFSKARNSWFHVVIPPSASQISLKLLSVTSCPFISAFKPADDANASVSNSNSFGNRNSSKQASISSASAHSSSGGSSATTMLLLLFIHTIESVPESDFPSLPL